MLEKITQWNDVILAYAAQFGMKILGAIALWIVGSLVIKSISNLMQLGMVARKMDDTLIRYTETALRVVLRIALIIAILSILGVETTSLAALLAAAGVAIGAAWSGLLSNFAAGIFLMILRPFKIGDLISAGGAIGDVMEIGLFATVLCSPDNLRVIVGNGKILGDNIINYTSHPYRRVDLVCQLAHNVDVNDAIACFKMALTKIPNIVSIPTPDCGILEFTQYGAKLAIRPYCHTTHYWQVYFDTNQCILDVCTAAGWAPPSVRQTNVPS